MKIDRTGTRYWISMVAFMWLTGHLTIQLSAVNASPVSDSQRSIVVKKIPVIFDTDIGDDIDDTWALGFMLMCPEIEAKLVVGDKQNCLYRAKLLAKLLERMGHADIPVGIGVGERVDKKGRQSKWIGDYDLESYPGKIYNDGVQAMIDMIMASEEQMTLLCVGPLPNIQEALKREPRIATRVRFVGMHGSVRLGYGGSKEISAEYNVRADVTACQAALSAAWPVTITPLDTCGLVQLKGNLYREVQDSLHPVARAIIENYRVWAQDPKVAETQSSILFDTVAVYLVFNEQACQMETIGIRVDNEGYTRIDPNAKQMNVATAWKDLNGFNDLLVHRITGNYARHP